MNKSWGLIWGSGRRVRENFWFLAWGTGTWVSVLSGGEDP